MCTYNMDLKARFCIQSFPVSKDVFQNILKAVTEIMWLLDSKTEVKAGSGISVQKILKHTAKMDSGKTTEFRGRLRMKSSTQ